MQKLLINLNSRNLFKFLFLSLLVFSGFYFFSQEDSLPKKQIALASPGVSCRGTVTIVAQLNQSVAPGDRVDVSVTGENLGCWNNQGPCDGASDRRSCSISSPSSSCNLALLDCYCDPWVIKATAQQGVISGSPKRLEGTSNPHTYTVNFNYSPPNHAPTCSISASSGTVSPEGTATINGSNSDPDNDAVTWVWWEMTGGSFPPPQTYMGPPPKTWKAPSSEGTYTITATVADSKGASSSCNTRVTVSAPVNQKPVCRISANPTTGNAPLAVQFDGSGSYDPDGSISAYAWNFGDGGTGSGARPSHTYTRAGTYTATLIVADNQNKPSDACQITITVSSPPANQKPVCRISANPTFGIAPLTVQFDGSGSYDSDGRIVAYAWNFGDATTGIGIKPQHTYGNPGVYTATLVVSDDKGKGSDLCSVVITVNEQLGKPVCKIAANPTSGKAPLTVNFDGSGSYDPNGRIVAYAWNFGDGVTGSDVKLSHTYKDSGVYRASLVVADNDGNSSDLCSVTITVNAPDTPLNCEINAEKNVIAPRQMTTIKGSASSSARWTFWTVTGGALNSFFGSPPKIYFAPSVVGIYTITARVADEEGRSASCSTSVTVQMPQELSCFVSGIDNLFVGKSGNYTVNASGVAPFQYSWSQNPEVGSFSNQLENGTTYTAPGIVPDGGLVTLTATVSNAASTTTCSKIVGIKSGIVQGRIFKDANESGKMDAGEEFVAENIGTVTIVPSRTEELPPQDDCSNTAQGYRYQIPPFEPHTLIFKITKPSWKVTGADWVKGSPSCDPFSFWGLGKKISDTEYSVDNVHIINPLFPTMNIWFGAQYAPPVCKNTPPTDILPKDSCLSPGNINYTWTSHTDTKDFWIQIDDTDGATNPDGSFVTALPDHNDWLGSNLASYNFDASGFRGKNIFFHVKSKNSCDEESPWSSIRRVYIDRAPFISDVTLSPTTPSPGATEITITVVFESASSGTVTLNYEIDGTFGSSPYIQSFNYDGANIYHSVSHEFTISPLILGQAVTATAEVRADNTSPDFSCGTATKSTSGSVGYDPWMQVIDGDVYSNFADTPDPNDPGIFMFIQPNPKDPPWKPYFLEASNSVKGGINIARKKIKLRNATPPPGQTEKKTLSEREWNIKDYPEEISWPLEILNGIRGSDSTGPIKIEYHETLPPIIGDLIRLEPTIIFVNRGDIVIEDSGVEPLRIEAVLLAKAGKIEIKGEKRLEVKGALLAYGGFELDERKATDNREPAIVVEYEPKFVLYAHPKLYNPQFSWREIEPK